MADSENLTFTAEECQQILESCFETKHIIYVGHILKSLAGIVEGYLATHYSMDITYKIGQETRSKQFFVKCLTKQIGFLAVFAKELDAFRRESFVYNYLFKEFEKISKHFKPFAPRCYYSKGNCLVLEDLVEQGYNILETQFYDLTQCKVTLKALSNYHAYSIIYEEIKSKETGKKYCWNKEFPEEFKERYYTNDESTIIWKYLRACLKSLCRVIEELPKEKCPDRDAFRDLLKKDDKEDLANKKYEEQFRHTCTHNDLWSNNIMFKKEKVQDEELVDCKLIDFQILRYSLPAFDLELFLTGNTSAEFRKNHKTELYRYYYDCLTAECLKNDVNLSEILSFQDLMDSAVLVSPRARVQALCDMVELCPEKFNEIAANSELFKSIYIDNRDKYLLDVYQKNSEFRTMYIQELLDLKVSLEEKQKMLCKIKLLEGNKY